MMETTTQTSYEQVLQLANQLSLDQIVKLKEDLNATLVKKKADNNQSFRNFLLQGPVMTDEQYKDFEENRKHFIEWRTK